MDSFLEECKLCHRDKERGVYRESKVASGSYSVGKERKTGVVRDIMTEESWQCSSSWPTLHEVGSWTR